MRTCCLRHLLEGLTLRALALRKPFLNCLAAHGEAAMCCSLLSAAHLLLQDACCALTELAPSAASLLVGDFSSPHVNLYDVLCAVMHVSMAQLGILSRMQMPPTGDSEGPVGCRGCGADRMPRSRLPAATSLVCRPTAPDCGSLLPFQAAAATALC